MVYDSPGSLLKTLFFVILRPLPAHPVREREKTVDKESSYENKQTGVSLDYRRGIWSFRVLK
jgi:hypothetical protein